MLLDHIIMNHCYKSSLLLTFLFVFAISSNAQKESGHVKGQWEFGVIAGASKTTLDFNSKNDYLYLNDATFETSTDFAGGFLFEYQFESNRKSNWSFYNELLYNQYESKGRYENIVSSTEFSIYDMQIGASYLSVVNAARFQFPVSKIKLFLTAGVSTGILLSETNYQRAEIYNFFVQGVEESEIIKTRSTERSYLLGSGVRYDRYTAEFRFQKGTGLSDSGSLGSPTKRLMFLLSYRF